MVKNTMTSWKTTTAAFVLAGSVLLAAIAAQIDANPETVPDWQSAITALIAAIGLLMAKDSDK